MIRTVLMASAVTMALVGGAQAAGMATRGADATGQFYATPNQKGAPTDLPGERLVPGASQAAQAIDMVVSPVVLPISEGAGRAAGQVVGGVVEPIGGAVAMGDAPAAAPAKMKMKRHHRMMRHKRMMKKKM